MRRRIIGCRRAPGGGWGVDIVEGLNYGSLRRLPCRFPRKDRHPCLTPKRLRTIAVYGVRLGPRGAAGRVARARHAAAHEHLFSHALQANPIAGVSHTRLT